MRYKFLYLKDKLKYIKISIHWYQYNDSWTYHMNDVEDAYPDTELRSGTTHVEIYRGMPGCSLEAI